MALDRDSILAAADLKTESVPVPEWGGEILVKTLAGSARDTADLIFKGGQDEGSNSKAARFIAACAVDEAGAPLFTAEDVPGLAAKASFVLQRVFKACLRVNGIGMDAVEDAAKN